VVPDARAQASREPLSYRLFLDLVGRRSIVFAVRVFDALLYRGREVTHYRYPLGHSQYSSLWFFFYIGENFVGKLD
jgi:hypothetical protein